MPSHPLRRATLLAVLLVTAPLLSTCSGDDDPPAAPRPTTTAPHTTLSPQQQDERALRQLADDWYAAIKRLYQGNGEPEDASAFVTGSYLDGFTDQLEAFRRSGNSAVPASESDHVVERVSVDGDSASVDECVVDADVLVGSDGTVINDAVVTKRYTTTAIRSGDGWRFDARTTTSEEEGQATCRG